MKGSDDTTSFSFGVDGAVAGFVVASTGYIKAITALLEEPLDSGDIKFGIEVQPWDGSESKTLHDGGIHFDSTDGVDAVAGYVTFDEAESSTLTVSPGDVVKFTVTHGTDDDVGPKDNTVSLVAHIAMKF